MSFRNFIVMAKALEFEGLQFYVAAAHEVVDRPNGELLAGIRRTFASGSKIQLELLDGPLHFKVEILLLRDFVVHAKCA